MIRFSMTEENIGSEAVLNQAGKRKREVEMSRLTGARGSILILLISLLMMSACGKTSDNRIVIAKQFGLGYAPLMIMEKMDLLKKYYPDAEVEWVQLGSGGAIREGMAAGSIDIGSMGVPPFLIAWAKGYDFKILTPLCEMPLGLQTNNPDVKTLADFTPDMKIALPSPGSIQHILLSMAAEKQLGNPKALDDRIIAMAHPDGVNALLNKVEITGHFTSPPFIFKELEAPGIHQVVNASRDAFGGDFTFLVTAATGKLKARNPKLFTAFRKALLEAIDLVNEGSDPVVDILASELKLDRSTVIKYLNWGGVSFGGEPKGLLKFLDFMNNAGYVEKNTDSVKDLMWQ